MKLHRDNLRQTRRQSPPRTTSNQRKVRSILEKMKMEIRLHGCLHQNVKNYVKNFKEIEENFDRLMWITRKKTKKDNHIKRF